MWNLSKKETNEVSPIEILKKFKDALKKDTNGDFEAYINPLLHENNNNLLLSELRLQIKHKSHSFVFLIVKQQLSDLSSEYPVSIEVNYFDKETYTNIDSPEKLEEKLTEIVGSNKTGELLLHIERCMNLVDKE